MRGAQPSAAPPPGSSDAQPPAEDVAAARRKMATVALGALGVVYGDIGTSPLYAMRECFGGTHMLPLTHDNVLGVLSLIFWSLIMVVTVKYLVFITRADNQGEGGTLALTALALRAARHGPGVKTAITMVGVFGASLLYGDGLITPAISVLSAVEGLTVIAPGFHGFVLPVTLLILTGLFVVQKRGTASVGAMFGPIMLVWFGTLTVLGISSLVRNPAVLSALLPTHGLMFLITNGTNGLAVMGAVFLVVTGGEALYADMGHFGRQPIRLAWFSLVLPALMINYLGQGALLLEQPEAISNPFYLLAPSWALYPLLLLSTLATCIASQALISGAFSLTRQAVQLGYLPRMEIIHTSADERGQIYIPAVNWALMVGVMLLVLGFRSSSALASAYGIAVTTDMCITSLLAYRVARDLWNWEISKAAALVAVFLTLELTFFSANLLKVFEGGWVPLALAALVFTVMTTWKRGREILNVRQRSSMIRLEDFLSGEVDVHRVRGTAVFMTGNSEGVPPALLHNLKHNKVLHERVVVLSMVTEDVPSVPGRERLHVEELPHGFWRVVARYGFMEQGNVQEVLGRARGYGLETNNMETTFFLGRETLVASQRRTMPRWRTSLFGWMSRNARSATAFFGIPPNRVVELGAYIEL